MNSRYATLFGIENLVLNQHFSSIETHQESIDSKPLTINSQLLHDITCALQPLTLDNLVQGDEIVFHNQCLSLPNSRLNSHEKRALWALMSQHLDQL